jgi:hypothetical protein
VVVLEGGASCGWAQCASACLSRVVGSCNHGGGACSGPAVPLPRPGPIRHAPMAFDGLPLDTTGDRDRRASRTHGWDGNWRSISRVQLHSLMSASDASISALTPISNRWDVAVNHSARFALPCSAIAFPLFGVCAARLGRMSRRLLVLATASAYVALFLVIDPQQVRALSPFLVAWWPTLSIAAIALLVRFVR